VVTQFATPILYQIAGDGSSKIKLLDFINKIFILMAIKLLSYSILALVLTLNSTFIVQLFAGPLYLKYVDYLPLLSVSAIIFILAQTLTLIVVSQLQSNLLINVKIFTALLAIIINYFFSIYFGLEGVVVSGLIFSILYFCWVLKIALNKISDIKLNEKY
jgi:O-antigen/teichoic acid export membrane protein